MPRGNPNQPVIIRLAPTLIATVKAAAGPRGFSAAVAEGLELWLARQKRRQGKTDPLAGHLAPATAREITARKKATAQPASVEVGKNGFVQWWPKTDGE